MRVSSVIVERVIIASWGEKDLFLTFQHFKVQKNEKIVSRDAAPGRRT